MKNTLSCVTSKFVLCYPVLYLWSMLVSGFLARKIALCFFVLLGIQMLLSERKMDCVALVAAGIFSLFNAVRFGLSYVIHADYYGLVLLLLVFIYYTDQDRIDSLEVAVLNEHLTVPVILLSFLAVFISIVSGKGLQTVSSWGTMPMLRGPFDLPHSLAYQMLLFYVLGSILWHTYEKYVYLLVMAMAFCCLVWTGVRSAFISMAILILCDFFAIRRKNVKIWMLIAGGSIFAYLLFFTDIVTNNPIVHKTLAALKRGNISNSRSDFNNYLAKVYVNSMDTFEKAFGMGMVQLRKTMWLRYENELHAHNDVFNTLVGHGIVGLSLFIGCFVAFCRKNKNGLWIFLVLMVLAYTNGLYMYVAFTPCIAIFLVYGKYLRLDNA